jgi:hypothetical protein
MTPFHIALIGACCGGAVMGAILQAQDTLQRTPQVTLWSFLTEVTIGIYVGALLPPSAICLSPILLPAAVYYEYHQKFVVDHRGGTATKYEGAKGCGCS